MNILPWQRGEKAMSLVELLCVLAIISIIAALYLGPISRAFLHVKKVLGH
jgi:prepilin-type N-terminal cleavage/methylation domain-containing protein